MGIPPSALQLRVGELMGHRIRVHPMLDFCAVHGITAESEAFPMADVHAVLPKVRANQVHYRAVLVR